MTVRWNVRVGHGSGQVVPVTRDRIMVTPFGFSFRCTDEADAKQEAERLTAAGFTAEAYLSETIDPWGPRHGGTQNY